MLRRPGVAVRLRSRPKALGGRRRPCATGTAFEPTIWYSIDRDGIVTVNIIRAEMGQHVGTALARILADELEADWDKVRIDTVDTDPKWGLMVTGGSWSVWQTFPVFSRAGAAGRIALIEAGAKLLGVPSDQCIARNGAVVAGRPLDRLWRDRQRGDLRRSFTARRAGQDADQARLRAPPDRARARTRSIFPRRPTARRVTGSTRRSKAWSMPGRRFRRPATDRGCVSIDDSAAKTRQGLHRSLALEDPSGTVPGWVMVIANSYPAAIRAADLVKVDWAPGDGANVSEQDILDHGAKQIADPNGGVLLVDDGTRRGLPASAQSTLEQTYTTSSVLHFQLEPVNALAFEKDGVFEIHTGNQWQTLDPARPGQGAGLPQEQIVMRTYPLGGGFGRRLNGDYAVPAALAAKALGKPVKMVLTRPDDMRFDSFRSPSIQTLRMAFDATAR